MNSHQHKILSTFIISAITFLGFEALSLIIGINQTSAFITSAVYLFLFHVFWIAFIFDLHLKHTASVDLESAEFRHILGKAISLRFQHFFNFKFLRHFFNYFVLPSILYWATVVLLFLNPFNDNLKQILIICSTAVFALSYWHLKEHLSAKLEAHSRWLRVLAVAKFYGVYIAFAAVIGYSWYFALTVDIVFYYILAASFFLIHQALFSYNFHKPGLVLVSMVCSALIAVVGVWVYYNWTYQYFTGALVLLVLYNTVWGLIHHYLDKTLDNKIALEYIIFGLLIISIIFSTHNFGTRLI